MKLTKTERNQLETFAEELKALRETLAEAMAAFNIGLAELREPVETAITAYNEKLSDAREFASDVASRLQDDISDKSEKWQESDAGMEASNLQQEWEQIELEDFELDLPEDLDESEPEHDETLLNMPIETE